MSNFLYFEHKHVKIFQLNLDQLLYQLFIPIHHPQNLYQNRREVLQHFRVPLDINFRVRNQELVYLQNGTEQLQHVIVTLIIIMTSHIYI